MNKKYFLIIAIVIVLIIGIYLIINLMNVDNGQISSPDIQFCQSNSNCKCCDIITSSTVDLLAPVAINKNYSDEIGCANRWDKDAFCANNEPVCINNKCQFK